MLKPPAQSAGLDHSPHYFMATLTRAGGNLQSEKEKSKKKTFAHKPFIPYGSKHCLRRYLTPQIIPQTLPKKVLGSIGINHY